MRCSSRSSPARATAAPYVCALVLVRSAEDPQPIIAEGEWHGEIVDVPRGAGGFGYDPYFLLPQMEQTAAETDAALKNTPEPSRRRLSPADCPLAGTGLILPP